MYFDQGEYDVRCEWGIEAIAHLAPMCDVVIIVDVLSFSTCVDVAVSRGAQVYPFKWQDGSAADFAERIGAQLAVPGRSLTGYSLSPTSLTRIIPGTRLVLPSPNGSTLTLATGEKPTLAGCLRNAEAVARAAERLGRNILVVPAGERWPDLTSLRLSIEDLIGAGAIIRHLQGSKSPEALIAQTAFTSASGNLLQFLRECSSGRELIEKDFVGDVELAAEMDVSACAPALVDGVYQV